MTTNSSPLQTVHPSQRRILWWNKKEVPAERPRPRCDYPIPVTIRRATGGAAFLAPFDLRKPVFEWVNSLVTLMLRIQRVLDCLAEAKVLIPNIKEVRDYLLQYTDLTSHVLLAARRAKERFNPATQLSLEVYRDPEIDDRYLALYVRQENYDDNILDAIDEISSEYEDMLSEREGWFVLTSDLHPPA